MERNRRQAGLAALMVFLLLAGTVVLVGLAVSADEGVPTVVLPAPDPTGTPGPAEPVVAPELVEENPAESGDGLPAPDEESDGPVEPATGSPGDEAADGQPPEDSVPGEPDTLPVRDIAVLMDGRELAFDVPPLLQSGRVLVPFRAVFAALGWKVTYDSEQDSIIAGLDGREMKLWPGYKVVQINDNWQRMDVKVTICDGRALVPLRFVSEATGAAVEWDEPTRTVTIATGFAMAGELSPIVLPDNSGHRKIAYLTLDDGPHPSITTEVLAILQAFGVKATFFVIGRNAEHHPRLIRQIQAGGHSIGNHTYSHNYQEVYASPEAFLASLRQAEAVLLPLLGYRPSLVRAPGGSFGHFTPEYQAMLAAGGYRYYDWNVSGHDSDPRHPRLPARDIIANVQATSRGRSRAIILLHDSAYHETTAEALPRIIDFLLDEGYVFAVLPAQ